MDTRSAEPASVGKILHNEFISPGELSFAELTEALTGPSELVEQILNDIHVLSDHEAEKLADYLGTSTDFWKNIRDAHLRWEKRKTSAF